MGLALGVGAGNADPATVLLVLVVPLGLGVLWGLVVLVHQRRQSRIDLVALEERLQAERARKPGRRGGGGTDRDIAAAQAAYEQARTSGLRLGRPHDGSEGPPAH